MSILLTPEQSAVVAHNHGPALVFAVAGAGKTTAMVHRIERLVRQRLYPPRQILATSFSKATVQDIETALRRWPHCQAVQVSTLHALGLSALNEAKGMGLIRDFRVAGDQGAYSERGLLKQVLGLARRRGLDIPNSFDEQDFLNYVGMCKGNFLYPSCEDQDLPPRALEQIQTATAPEELPEYLSLYALYEETRRELGVIGFDDMLLSAWELLLRFPELLARIQQRFSCVLVDEFQDVNAVQSELLDLLVAEHGNYMAIGDDDQTIYEWRGASTRYILEFAERYQAKTFILSENFRSYASHLALANRVIAHNSTRRSKHLRLTRGFAGRSFVRRVQDEAAQAEQLVMDVLKACQAGYSFEQQAILLRLYAQSPFLEQGLIEAGIPYKIVGSQPFYRRSEIKILMAYLELAQLERQIQAGHALTATQLNSFHSRWMGIANRPVRYLRRQHMDWIYEQIRRGESLIASLHRLLEQAESKYKAKLMRGLIEVMEWLVESGLDADAAHSLQALEARLDYCQYLRKSSGFPETGEGRALTVEVFLDYAKGRGDCDALYRHLDHLQQAQSHDGEALILTTIFRAKGLEWPVVHIPHCNQGYLPYSSAHSLEEERRLFYVAMTRPRELLYLYSLNNLPLSRFLKEAAYEQTLNEVQRVESALQAGPQSLDVEDLLRLARQGEGLVLKNYLERWWPAAPHQRKALKDRLQGVLQYALKQDLTRALSISVQEANQWGAQSVQVQDTLAQAVQDYISQQSAKQEKSSAPPAPVEDSNELEASTEAYDVGDRVWSEHFGVGEVLALDSSSPQGALLEVDFAGKRHKLLARYAGLQKSF